ncbi:hypothetical protein [Paracoccus thiocyanatus]|uniref:hypothetical protein n=1 Tax=Paracoccus thiocyanatus TaxID=34006 RepID=UPI002163DEDE|nr:hypothetical protein [Paracoccus thiocyanatus]
MTDARLILAERLGVSRGFRDHAGQWRETSVETAEALLAALGRPRPRPRRRRRRFWTKTPGSCRRT